MKKTKIIAIILILFFGIIVCGDTFAVDQKMLGAELNRPFNDDNGDKTVGNDRYVLEHHNNIFTATKIYDKDDVPKYLSSIYCLRGGKGFGVGVSELNNNNYAPVQYNKIGNLKENAKPVIEEYEKLYGVNLNREEEITFDGITKKVNLYNALLWIVDNAYLPNDIKNAEGEVIYSASEFRTQLLNNAVIKTEITDDDIEVVQQFAMWYFVNYDEQAKENFGTVSQKDENIFGFVKIGNGTKFADYEESKNKEDLTRLYKYFIKGAIENAEKYGAEDIRQNGIDANNLPKLEDTKPQKDIIETKGNKHSVFGPFEIAGDINSAETNIKVYAINEKKELEIQPIVIDGIKVIQNKNETVSFVDKIEDVVGQGEFYIKIPQNLPFLNNLNIEKIKIVLTNSYYKTTSTAWEADKNAKENQAVVIIEREKITTEDSIETEEPKEFDLSLRKFITSIDGKEVEGRTPKVENETLINGRVNEKGKKEYTATYKHDKNALEVQTGSKVIYTIRVYNEGQIAGTATEVTDYLPEGLKFVPVSESTINSQYKWVLSADEKTLTTDYLKDKTIQAFEEGKELNCEDLKIECEVIAKVSQNNQVLRNIAAITADTGDDRDSEPEHIADRGEGYNPPADNSTYQQDDDDYELLILKGKYFDLALRKFITSVERDGKNIEIADREPKIYIKDLKNETATTARYVHPKNLLTLKKGDIITYTLRIYNEGQLDGYATLVKDYLPEGLELVEGKNDIWAAEGNTLTTDSLKEQKLLAYNKNVSQDNKAEANWQKAQDDESGLYYLDLQVVCRIKDTVENGQILKNVAEIYNHKAEVENDIDSAPGNVYEDQKHELGNEVNGYTPGEEDDDDFERVTIESNEIFDLALRKYIVAVNGVELAGDREREPKVYTKPLQQLETTANYNHKKEPVSVKAGDEITYRFATYNEGNIDGYVYSIIDYLPEYLEFIPTQEFIAKEEFDKLSYDEGKANGVKYVYEYNAENKKIIVSRFHDKVTDSDGSTLWGLKAYDDGDLLDSKYLDLKFKVKDNFVSEKDIILTNVATMEYGSVFSMTANDDKEDRDSKGAEFTVPTQEQLVSENKVAYKGHSTNKDDLKDSEYYYKGQQDDDDFEKIIIRGKSFDLALRKYIVGIEVSDKSSHGPSTGIRIPKISIDPLKQGETTAEYKHRKDPVEVEVGNIVEYRFTVYNEGDIDGYVYSIIDHLPEGLTFDAESNTTFIEYKEEYLEEELIGKEYAYKIEGNKITILPIKTDNLFELSGFKGETLDNKSVDVKFKVTVKQSNEDQVLTNVATMTYGAKDTAIADRDSNKTGEEFNVPTAEKLLEGLPGYKGHEENKTDLTDENYHYKGQQDDDDFEKLIIKGIPFDLSLRKFITSVERNGKQVEFEDRTPKIDATTLINGTFSRNGQNEYTATYEHSKEPLIVRQGDIVTYTLRIYNEGERAGYATEITDYIPEGLALIVQHKENQENKWKLPANIDTSKIMSLVGQNGFYKTEEDVKNIDLEDLSGVSSLKEVQLVTGKVNVTSDALKDELIKPFDSSLSKDTAGENWQAASKGQGGLYYRDIELTCLVIEENTSKDILTNIAEISEDKDENKQDVLDRDSTPNNVNGKNEDDDDYEPIMLKYFDLALRKFITGVESKGTTTEVTSRIPELTMGQDGKIKYEHSKEPLEVVTGNTVIYTLRVYNEGTIAGYAEEIKDNIPEGLKYLPEHAINKQYEWVMVDNDGNITENSNEAVEITTDYLSQSKEVKKGLKITDEITGKTTEPVTRENIINPFDSSKQISENNPSYKDVKIAFEVTEPSTSDRIIVNSAQISEDSDNDEDSIPDKWNEGEDDQDREYIYVKYFDLSLLKWVTKSIVTVDGKTTTTQTGFKPNQGKTETTGIRNNQEAEPIAKVELDRKKLNKTTVKFTYKIRVTNEGEIAGYATEITDYIPAGLEFYPEDETNKKYGWVKTSDSKITTRALETVLLEPNESAELEITFRWKNNVDNLGIKTNIAEISEDYNDYGTKDIDSTTDNILKPYEKEQEDDDDFALVILSIVTGKGTSYFAITTAVLAILAAGIYLIKKYVLTY